MKELNLYTNGSAEGSQQFLECQQNILKDKYVFNVVNCNHNLMNYTSEVLTKESRSLQIPTFDATGGSRYADLNNPQHTISLDGTCLNVYDFYDITKTDCFLSKRLELLKANGCTSTAQ